MTRKFKGDWFLMGMAATIGLAWIFPGPGAAGGWLHPALATKISIALIFFLHGLLLSFGALKAGAMRWPLHLLVQAGTFLLFPLIGLALYFLLGTRIPPDLKLGVFFLCALPSTVSSSVALTAAARGNVAGAVFNATLSSLLGIFLTPFWIALLLHTSGETRPLIPTIVDLLRWLALPLAVGQLLHPWLGGFALAHKAKINVIDRLLILLLIYTSFCDSFKMGIWSGQQAGALALVLIITAVLFVVVMWSLWAASVALKFSREDRITAMFCGSKKTLASGASMAKLIFGAHPALSIILLPIMIYHPLQLIVCGVLAERWRKQGATQLTNC